MGMFNHVRCRYPLPDAEAQDFEFQTKSMDELTLDNFETTPDGRLLHEAYDTRLEENPTAPFGFYFHRENCRWEPENFTGELEIHTSAERPGGIRLWYSSLVEFQNGRVIGLQHGHGHGDPLPRQPRV